LGQLDVETRSCAGTVGHVVVIQPWWFGGHVCENGFACVGGQPIERVASCPFGGNDCENAQSWFGGQDCDRAGSCGGTAGHEVEIV
jgi:hypothetical protein